jgi:hypothetical protein
MTSEKEEAQLCKDAFTLLTKFCARCGHGNESEGSWNMIGCRECNFELRQAKPDCQRCENYKPALITEKCEECKSYSNFKLKS